MQNNAMRYYILVIKKQNIFEMDKFNIISIENNTEHQKEDKEDKTILVNWCDSFII